MNNNEFYAQDVSLVRMGMFGYYERSRHLANTRIGHRAAVLLSSDEIDELALAEMRRWVSFKVMPARVRIRRRFPFVPTGARGQVRRMRATFAARAFSRGALVRV